MSHIPIHPQEFSKACKLIHKNLCDKLLAGSYKNRPENAHPTWGHCTVAAEALYFLLGGPLRGLVAYVAKEDDGTTHWWLQDKEGKRYDPTAAQYYAAGKVPPYERGNLGKACGFMGQRSDPQSQWGFGRRPSKRAALLLERMMQDSPEKTRKLMLKKTW